MLKQLDQIWHSASPERKIDLTEAKERGPLSDVTYMGNQWLTLSWAPPYQSCGSSWQLSAPLCCTALPALWHRCHGCKGLAVRGRGEELRVRLWWGVLASSVHILTDFHSNWQIGNVYVRNAVWKPRQQKSKCAYENMWHTQYMSQCLPSLQNMHPPTVLH